MTYTRCNTGPACRCVVYIILDIFHLIDIDFQADDNNEQ